MGITLEGLLVIMDAKMFENKYMNEKRFVSKGNGRFVLDANMLTLNLVFIIKMNTSWWNIFNFDINWHEKGFVVGNAWWWGHY